MNRRLRLAIDTHDVIVVPHAIQRYTERACRYDDATRGADELWHLLFHHGRVQAARPEWVHVSDNATRTDSWLLLGDDIAFPLERAHSGVMAAMTCICRAGIGEHRHSRRKRRRRKTPLHRIERRWLREKRGFTLDEEAA